MAQAAPRRVGATQAVGWAADRATAAAAASWLDRHRPKTVAPEPDMRARATPGAAATAETASAMAGVRASAGD